MSDKYKTYEELKEELGNKFEEYMYKANIELLEKINKGGFCELKKKCDEGLCDCTNEEYDSMAECNMKLSLENDKLQQALLDIKELQDNYLKEIYKGNVDLRLASLTLCKIDNIVNEALGDKENENKNN